MPTRPFAAVLHQLRRIDAEAGAATDAELLRRFVRHREDAAFAALLQRHGPMVAGVCRRLLRDRHDAEDAFQATFLVLVRKAASLAQPDRLGPWLHGVAYRIALKARARARRHARTGALLTEPAAAAADDAVWRDLRPVLDAAIDDLPPRYRAPFVLCHLQGLTQAQAARQLDCPENTVATRLARARQRLRLRLARYHPGAAGAVVALGLGAGATSAAVPALLAVSTVRLAAALRTGPTTAVPAAVITLMEGVCPTMFMTKLQTLGLVAVLVLAVIGGTAALALGGRDDDEPAAPTPVKTLQAPPVVAIPAVPPVTVPAVVRTEHFEVHAPNRRLAQLVAEAAERFRKSEAIRWLGQELPAWPERCTINVSGGPDGHGHATTFQFERGRVQHRAMTLDGTLEQLLSIGLPHEMTHVVLADYFGVPVVRWADEGAAVLAEDEEEQQRYRARMHALAAPKGRRIPLRHLLPMKDYPSDVAALYLQGHSLTRFLVERNDRKTFLAFVKHGMAAYGWDAAVRRHYGLADVDALEQAWLAHVRQDAERSARPAEQRPALKSLPPTIARARVDADGRLVLRTPIVTYVQRTYQTKDTAGNPASAMIYYQPLVTEQEVRYSVAEVRATDLAGKPIGAQALGRRLQAETMVLRAATPDPIDPVYLSIIREDTIVLHLGAPVTPPAPLAPPAVPPDGAP